ncbi:hypothetical protein GGF46_001392 [Coemansia sp. RSA 552]|nr:hypothetical protein GGF46_001392 [Coemansia sp. RSA 552]
MSEELECGMGETGAEWNRSAHIVALFAIVGASAVGVFLPIIGQTIHGLRQMAMPMFLIQLGQFFGAGVIVATAFLHLFPTANNALSDPCLDGFSELYGAWAWLIAMAAVFTMHSIEWWLMEAWGGRAQDQHNPGAIDDSDGESSRLFPEYGASRMVLPILSPPVNPRVFGTASRVAGRGGFALTRHGNYVALAQSRQHLAMVQSERYLFSDPQFPKYASSIWPMPPVPAPPALALRNGAQAKSTPELMRRQQKSARLSQQSTQSSTQHTGSSHAVSLRPGSFTNANKDRHRRRMTRQKMASAASWKQRCLSMPRLPPTTLDAGLCESLLEPLPPLPDMVLANKAASPGAHTSHPASRMSPQSTSGESRTTSRPISMALAGPTKTPQRLSLQAFAARAAHRNSAERSDKTSPGRLGTVHEDWGVAAAQYLSPDDASAGQVFASAKSALPPQDASLQSRPTHGSSQKRVSIPIPPVLRAAPSSCVFRSVEATAPQRLSGAAARLNIPKPETSDGASTANPDRESATSTLTTPLEVRKRALATYILELGIALYSVLMGLALAMSDRGFVALFIAICFHQFFEGLALGTSLAELYWIKAQLAAHRISSGLAADIGLPATSDSPNSQGIPSRLETIVSARTSEVPEPHCVVDVRAGRTSPESRRQFQTADSDAIYSEDFEHVDPVRRNRTSKSRRTLASMATSFTPEPWLVNPQLEKTLGGTTGQSLGQRGASTTLAPDAAAAAAEQARKAEKPPLPRYLVPRNKPERMPGWWKAWVSALAFCTTTPVGIIIGLALHNVYEPSSRYALLLNGVLQSICTGVLIYAGLVTLVIGGFNSAQVKRLPRLMQFSLFLAVYAGAAVMAGLKIWK